MSETDIVERLRDVGHRNFGVSLVELATVAADTIEQLRAEIDRLGQSLDKCHAKLMSANSPVDGPEVERELLAGGRYRRDPWHPPECGGFQGSGD